MEFFIRGADKEYRDATFDLLWSDLSEIDDLTVAIEKREGKSPLSSGDAVEKGDPITLISIAVVAVGAGGALTAALGPDGFFTKLAVVLESYCTRKVDLYVKGEDGREMRLSGSAKQIERIIGNAVREEE